MTPKEKAEELIYKFCTFPQLDWTDSKQCALLAVNQIIEILSEDLNHLVDYWFEVKQEINQL